MQRPYELHNIAGHYYKELVYKLLHRACLFIYGQKTIFQTNDR